MSILINLLPDIRQAKLRERRRKQLSMGIAVLVWVVCGVVILLLSVYVAGQKVIISTTTKSIADKKQELQKVPGIIDALTAEYNLEALPGLYDKRVYMTKFFQAYSESDPANVALGSLNLDSQGALVVNGTGTDYAAVAKLARALEASNVQIGTGASASNTPYFTDVSIVSASGASGSKGVNFTLNAILGSGVTSADK